MARTSSDTSGQGTTPVSAGTHAKRARTFIAVASLMLVPAGALRAQRPRAREGPWQELEDYWAQIRTVQMDYRVRFHRPDPLPPLEEHGRFIWRTDDSAGIVASYEPIQLESGITREAKSIRACVAGIYRTVYTRPQLNDGNRVVAGREADPWGWVRGQILPRDFHSAMPPAVTWHQTLRAGTGKHYTITRLENVEPDHVSLRVAPADGVWESQVILDVRRGRLPVRQEVRWRGKKTGYTLEVIEAIEYAPGRWYPSRLRRTDRGRWPQETKQPAGSPENRDITQSEVLYTFTNIKINEELKDDVFKVPFPAGAVVHDRIRGERYVVPPGGEKAPADASSDARTHSVNPEQDKAVATHLNDVAAMALAFPPPEHSVERAENPEDAEWGSDEWLRSLDDRFVQLILKADTDSRTTRLHCGMYCLYQAASLLKQAPPGPHQLRELMHAQNGICSAAEMVAAARELGFLEADAVRVAPAELEHLPLPAVAFRHGPKEKEGHFVLLARGQGDLVQVVDYPRYVAWVPLERLRRFTDSWRGEVVLLQKADCPRTPARAVALGVSILCLAAGLAFFGRACFRQNGRSEPEAGVSGNSAGIPYAVPGARDVRGR